MQARFAGPVRAGTLAALVLAGSTFAGLGAAPGVARGVGPLPDCRYDDIMTSPRGYDDWPVTLVDTILRVSHTYVPPDLVDVSEANIKGNGRVRAILVDDLREMAAAAKDAGVPIAVQSAYRSYATQEVVFTGWVAFHGRKRALQLSARPGHSEHQLGIAIDFRAAGGGDPFSGDWQHTPQGKWMKTHAWEYGFVMSYPKGKLDVTCYDFEPWHFRYVGRDLAAGIHASGLTPREYLWANHTTAEVPPKTPKPDRPPKPTEAPSATPEASVEPTAAPTTAPAPTLPPPTAAPATAAPPIEPGAPSAVPTQAAAPAPSLPPLDPVGDLLRDPVMLAGMAVAALALLIGLAVTGWKVLRGRRGPLGL